MAFNENSGLSDITSTFYAILEELRQMTREDT